MCVFFFKQKTAYEMRISDWSSDVCSSDLIRGSQLARREGRTDFPVLRDPYGQHHSVIAESRKPEWGLDIMGAIFGCWLKIEAVRHAGKQCEIGRASCRERWC